MQKSGSGMLLMLASTLLFGAGNLFAKLVGRSVSSWETVFFRAAGGILFAVLLVRLRGKRFAPVNRRLLVLRGLFGALSLSCYFYGLKYSGLTRATLLTYTFPVFATIFSSLFYREKPGRGFWPLFAVAMTGVLLIIRPGSDEFALHDLIPLAGGVLAGGAIAAIRELRHTDLPETVFTSFMLFGILVSAPFALPRISVYSPETWGWIAAMIIATSTAQVMMSHAYRKLTVSVGSVIQLLTVLSSALLAVLFLGEPLSAATVGGGALMLLATVLIILKRER